MTTAERHALTCERFAARLSVRVAERTRVVANSTSEYSKRPENILRDCVYNMRALYLTFERVKGFKVETVPCDARCTGARGHNCECSCGGANHGKANAIAAGMV